ncbi:hypothetical protein [Peribacillus frigoritolerans]|uniref:hypothetical protein n=1 Tax=Peribacillus frigoritolerans TaxID=450367 RepID=UPI00343DAC1C
MMESELIGRGHAAFTGEFGANTHEFGANTGEFGANTREFGAFTREFGANTREFGAFTREFGANTREFDVFTGEFGAKTRETQKRTCFFTLSFTMHLEFNEEFVVLTCQLHDTFIN